MSALLLMRKWTMAQNSNLWTVVTDSITSMVTLIVADYLGWLTK